MLGSVETEYVNESPSSSVPASVTVSSVSSVAVTVCAVAAGVWFVSTTIAFESLRELVAPGVGSVMSASLPAAS